MAQERDDIIGEIRQIREEIAKEHNYDIHAIVESFKKVALPPGSSLVTLSPKKKDKSDSLPAGGLNRKSA